MDLLDPRFKIEITSDKDVHYVGALAQNESEAATFTSVDDPSTGVPAGLTDFSIYQIQAQSDQNLLYRLHFARTVGFDDTNLDADTIIDYAELDFASDGVQYKGANQYYLTLNILPVFYYHTDTAGSIFTALENKDSTGKNAGATGEIKIKIIGASTLRSQG